MRRVDAGGDFCFVNDPFVARDIDIEWGGGEGRKQHGGGRKKKENYSSKNRGRGDCSLAFSLEIGLLYV